MTLRSIFSFVLVSVLAGCGGGTTATDAGAGSDTGSSDAGNTADTGAVDTGTTTDAGDALVALCTQTCERQTTLCGTHPDCTRCAASASDPLATACRSEALAATQCYFDLPDAMFCDTAAVTTACATQNDAYSACAAAHSDAGTADAGM